jgi:hypothetical protein
MANPPKKAGRVTPKKDKPEPVVKSFREILNIKEPGRIAVPVCMRPSLTDALADAQHAVNVEEQYRARLEIAIAVERSRGQVIDEEQAMQATATSTSKLDQVVAARDAAQAEVDGSTFTFLLEAIGNVELDRLMNEDEFLPTRDQQEAFKKRLKALGKSQNEDLLYNDETFPPALVARCCIAVLPGRRRVADIGPDEIPDERPISRDEAIEMWESPNWNRGELGTLTGAAWSVNEIAT